MPVEIAGKCDRSKPMRGGKIERRAIAGRQQLLLALAAAAPHRPDRVDHMLGRQPIAARDLGAAGLAAAERPAFGEQFRSGGAMDGAVDAAAAEQRAVRRIDDRIERKRRDVGNADFKPGGADFGRTAAASSCHHATQWYHAHSACASARRSTVLFTPISSKCSSRKRRAARLPLTCSISKKS